MLAVVLGITFGALAGLVENHLLFRILNGARRAGREPAQLMGGLFFVRYLIDVALLLVYWALTRSAYGVIAAAISLTIAVKISLFIVYTRKGGRFD